MRKSILAIIFLITFNNCFSQQTNDSITSEIKQVIHFIQKNDLKSLKKISITSKRLQTRIDEEIVTIKTKKFQDKIRDNYKKQTNNELSDEQLNKYLKNTLNELNDKSTIEILSKAFSIDENEYFTIDKYISYVKNIKDISSVWYKINMRHFAIYEKGIINRGHLFFTINGNTRKCFKLDVSYITMDDKKNYYFINDVDNMECSYLLSILKDEMYEEIFKFDNKNLAEQGDAKAQNELATKYYNGDGVEKDIEKAFYWYEKSAQNGNIDGQVNTAGLYYMNKDYKNALIWYKKAANQNSQTAIFQLGYMYKKGIGVKKDKKASKFWWKKGCDLGHKSSCNQIKETKSFKKSFLKGISQGASEQVNNNLNTGFIGKWVTDMGPNFGAKSNLIVTKNNNGYIINLDGKKINGKLDVKSGRLNFGAYVLIYNKEKDELTELFFGSVYKRK